jgi:hypothetical protein
VGVLGALAMKASRGQGGSWLDRLAELPRRGFLRGWSSGEDACVVYVGLRQRRLFTVKCGAVACWWWPAGSSPTVMEFGPRHGAWGVLTAEHGYADRVAVRRLINHHCLGPCTVHGCIDLFNVPFHHPIPRSAYRDGRANSYLEVETEVGT